MAYDLYIGAATLFMETSGECLEGKVAVAHVLVNRLKNGGFGRTLSEICLRYRQFSGWNDKDPNGIRFARASDADLALYKTILAEVLNGESTDPTGGAVFYFNPKLASPSWDFTKLIKTATIGNHVFYKNK